MSASKVFRYYTGSERNRSLYENGVRKAQADGSIAFGSCGLRGILRTMERRSVLWFSGSGNSLAVARDVAESIGVKLVSITFETGFDEIRAADHPAHRIPP